MGVDSKANLLEHVLFQIGTKLVPNFNVRYMQGIAKLLDIVRFASGCGGQCEYSEMRILVHEFSDNLRVSVITLPLMCFIYVSATSQGS